MQDPFYVGVSESPRQQAPGGSQWACSHVRTFLTPSLNPAHSTLPVSVFILLLSCVPPVHWDPGFSCVPEHACSWLVTCQSTMGSVSDGSQIHPEALESP